MFGWARVRPAAYVPSGSSGRFDVHHNLLLGVEQLGNGLLHLELDLLAAFLYLLEVFVLHQQNELVTTNDRMEAPVSVWC